VQQNDAQTTSSQPDLAYGPYPGAHPGELDRRGPWNQGLIPTAPG
jgi:hypothetical protein